MTTETEETDTAEANRHLTDQEMIEAVSEEEMTGLEMIAIKDLHPSQIKAAENRLEKIIHYNIDCDAYQVLAHYTSRDENVGMGSMRCHIN